MTNKEPSQKHWSQLEEKGTYWGIRLIFGIYSVLGRVVLAPILYPLVFYYFLFGKLARRSSRTYLQRVMARNDSSFRVSNWHSFRHFMAFAQSVLDKIGSWAGKIRIDQVNFPSRKDMTAAVKSGEGGILIGAHLGSIEVGRALSKEMKDLKMTVLVHTSHAENFNRVLRQINPESQAELMQVTTIGPDTAMILKEKIQQGEFVAILGDRTPVISQGREVWLSFLGREAPFPQGPYILAGVLGCPLYMLTCVHGRVGFDVYFDVISERVVLPRKARQEAIKHYGQLYADKLAYYTQQYPYQWFNFFDFWHEFDNRKEHSVREVNESS